MNHSGLEHPPDGIDMFIDDRIQQMEREAVKTTYCKRQRMAEWNRWRELLRRAKGYQSKENKVYIRTEKRKRGGACDKSV